MNCRYGNSRRTLIRPVLPVIDVVCDDTRTAAAYFSILKQEVRGRKVVNVVCAPKHGATADDVIESARAPSPDDAQDKSFALIDIDTCPDVNRIRAKAQNKNVQVLFSKPCFEIWTLAHLHSTGEAFLNCSAVLTEVKQRWKERFGSEFGPKAQAQYQKLMETRGSAIANCKARNPDANQSWTEVWRAVETIIL